VYRSFESLADFEAEIQTLRRENVETPENAEEPTPA
jgi:transcriptional regulator NrdR family protein